MSGIFTSHRERISNLFLIGWRPISLEQRGPDGSEILGIVLFYICPVCAALVAEGDEQNMLLDEHKTYHEQQADWMDMVEGALGEVGSALGAKCTFPDCESTEDLRLCTPHGMRCGEHHAS